MTITPLIRAAKQEDAALLTELGARTFYDAFAATNTPENMDSYMCEAFHPAKQAEELADAGATFLIAEVDGEAVGYAKLLIGEPPDCVPGPAPVELVRFYVAQEWHGRGVSHAMMQACLDRARQAGHQTVWLGVWEHNPRAQSFYRKWQFEVVGDHIFPMGSDPQTDYILARPL